jgi:hypothetical protein
MFSRHLGPDNINYKFPEKDLEREDLSQTKIFSKGQDACAHTYRGKAGSILPVFAANYISFKKAL